MQALLLVLFVIGCLLAALGALVTFLLTDRPRSASDHMASLGRMLILGGALFGACRAGWSGWEPWPEMVAFVVGIGILTALYAWRNYKAAVVAEGGHEWWEPIRALLHRALQGRRAAVDSTDEHSGT
jgi:hypothetical protein